jgi:hypothetical protein
MFIVFWPNESIPQLKRFSSVFRQPHFWRWVKKIGFIYKRTSKVVVPLDTRIFMAACARYFAAIDELRTNGSKIFWHDETCMDSRHFLTWIDRTASLLREKLCNIISNILL